MMFVMYAGLAKDKQMPNRPYLPRYCPSVLQPHWTTVSLSEPVPQLRDSWDNTWCYRKPRRYRFPPCKASNLITVSYAFLRLCVFSLIMQLHVHRLFDDKLLLECRGRAVSCIGLKFWCCQNVGSNVGSALVSLSTTLNHNCFVLRMGRKAAGPVCCVMRVKEPRTLIVKEKGLAPMFLDWLQMRQKAL